MRKLRNIEMLLATLANIIVLIIFIGLFILIFFYPETAGEIAGKIVNSFNDMIKTRKL